ncbi:MAG TPA: BON domain-containing protein [Methylomirabilota bacterium]|jgi:osmotically-inducible protein OsmY|nr:BON domain-containing protein [Methylomirabilota bacterium]
MRFMTTLTTSLLAVSLVALPGLAGAAGETTGEKAKNMAKETKAGISDSWLTSKTKITLFADDRVKGSQIHVETQNGVIMLRGKVDSSEAKSAATEIAKGIDGVKDVKNELQVVAPSQRKAVDATDKEITRHVQDRLSKDARLKGAKIDVRTDSGVVILTGEVPNISASARASELAREVRGVRSVKNDLAYQQRSSRAAPVTKSTN